MVREQVNPTNIPSEFIKNVDKDEFYSEIIHDPEFMNELLEMLGANRHMHVINKNDYNFPELEPSGFTITSFDDSIETTRVPREETGGPELFENMSLSVYLTLLLGLNWLYYSEEYKRERKEYRRLLKKAKGKE